MTVPKPIEYWEVFGTSWKGHITKREKKIVAQCGHRHTSYATATRCIDSMRRKRPGKCPDYRAINIVLVRVPKSTVAKRSTPSPAAAREA